MLKWNTMMINAAGISIQKRYNMPVMPRPKTKATEIAYKVLGKPDNLKKKKRTPLENYINRRLLFEETARVR